MGKEISMSEQIDGNGNPATGDAGQVDPDPQVGGQAADQQSGSAGGGSPSEGTEDASVKKLHDFMKKKGITDVGELVNLAERQEKDNTFLRQDVQRLTEANRYAPQPAAQPAAQPEGDIEIELPENPMELVMNKDKLKGFVTNLRSTLKKELRAEIVRESSDNQKREMQLQVQEKMQEDPAKFRKLRPIMISLSQEAPGANIHQLYSMAEKEYEAQRKARLDEFKEDLGIETDVDLEQLKKIAGRVRPNAGAVSAGTGSQVNVGAQSQEDKQLIDAIMNADKY